MKIFSPILKGTTTVAQDTTNLSGSFTGSLFGTAATASYADNFTVGGTLTAQTINVQIITSSIEFNTGSTRNGALSTNTHQFTGSVLMSGSLNVGSSATVAIGTSSDPAVIVSGNTSATISGNAKRLAQFRYNTADSTGIDLGYDATAGNGVIAGGTSANGAGIDFWTYNGSAWGNRVTINKSGSVGIGSTSPLGNLEVRGVNRLISADGIFQVNSSNSVGIDLGGSLSFGGAYQSSDVTEWAQISGRKETATSGQYGGYLDFATRPHLGVNTSRIRITSGGSILIGTTTDNSNAAGNILHQATNETAAFIHRGPYNIANGGTKTLDVQNGSLIFVSENNTGDGALFHACYISATVTIIANPSGRFANTDTASKICVFKSAANGYATLKNNAGSTFQFTTYIIKNSD
jgi:hypothetical protein